MHRILTMDLKLPHLGEGADSGTVVNLFVKEICHRCIVEFDADGGDFLLDAAAKQQSKSTLGQ